MHKKALAALALALPLSSFAQGGYWQNHVDYKMDIQMNVETHQFTGEQWLTFTNNSPDTITEVFYHLYFNAFQPESMMDTRSRNIADPDGRVKARIQALTPEEIGYHHIGTLDQDGMAVSYDIQQTIMKVKLSRPIVPGDASVFHMTFDSQVPVQIRRSGRDNSEDIEFSMSQWYPKMAMYDRDGWHADPYVGREFYGEFGRFVVDITIDKDYVVGGTGVLTNPEEVGHGYTEDRVRRRNNKITYKFVAENVHDFAWAADEDFEHKIVSMEDGRPIHFFYQKSTANEENWEKLMETAPAYFKYMNEHFGEYQYPQFSVIQAGDGGMEYPMCTFILGSGGSYNGFLGLFVHEATHNWYYGQLGTNEAMYPWMDEGFTTFAEDETMAFLTGETGNPHARTYSIYAQYQNSPIREPMSTPGDHFNTNRAYSISSYYLGSIFLSQLRGVVGEEAFWKGMMTYFNQWHFKHPHPEDFIRVMERESGMILDWYLNYWVSQTKSIDYAVIDVTEVGLSSSGIQIARLGQMPMPVDVTIKLKAGTEVTYTIPLVMMQGVKPGFLPAPAWPWTHPTYTLQVDFPQRDIESIRLNTNGYTADINTSNDFWPQPQVEVEEAGGAKKAPRD